MALFDVFISYSRFDTKAVNSLIARLRRDIADIKIWYDVEMIDSMSFFMSKVEDAIDRCDTTIFVCSDNSLAKEHCRKEVLYAKKKGKKVIPYLLPSMKLKSWLAYEFGTLSVINASKEDEVRRMIKSIKTRKISNEAPIPTAPTQDVDSLNLTKAIETEEDTQGESPISNNAGPTETLASTELASSGMMKGHVFVDLGLPSGVKWAICNIGANTPEGLGDHFAWSELEPKLSYSTTNCISFRKDIEWLHGYGYIGSRQRLEMSHDVARYHWGGTWRIPSGKEIEELIKNTDWEWIELQGVKGYKVQSKINGGSIFIPASGYREGEKLFGVGERGILWSSSANDGAVEVSYALAFTSEKHFLGLYNRYLGLTVRAVTD